MISVFLSMVGALLPSMLVSAVAVLTGLWVLSRGYRGPGVALVLWATVQASAAFAALLFTLLGFQAYEHGRSMLGLEVVGAIAHAASSVLLVALLSWAALGDRISPSEPRS